ncbi:hypothetical protein R3P38DRAFT_3249958, partial [Favolaschia claudopus]
MDDLKAQDISSSPHSNHRMNNPFLDNAAADQQLPTLDTSSTTHSTSNAADRTDTEISSRTSNHAPRKSSSSSKARPSLISTFLNFGLTPTVPEQPIHGEMTSKSDGPSTSRTPPQSKNFITIPIPSIPIPIVSMKARRPSEIIRNVTEVDTRRKFICKLAKALMAFGAPSHRIESQLTAASKILDAQAEFVQLPNLVIVTIRNGGSTASTRIYFIRARGRISLSRLNAVHHVYRKVLHDKLSAEEGTDELRKILKTPPPYNLWLRCFFSFICASILCVLSFGGSLVDMWVSGCCAATLQYLGLNAANKSAMYANVYEVSATIIVAFIARGLSNIPGGLFCYSAISSAGKESMANYAHRESYMFTGVIVILPGFTVLLSALELMSKNVFCGSVRIVYAIIYTLFLGFGLTIGSDLYFVVDRRARRTYYEGPAAVEAPTYTHGVFMMTNGTQPGVSISGVLSQTGALPKFFKGCVRDPHWHWTRQPFPWWTMLFLVPLYSFSSSLSNLQSLVGWNSRKQLAIMIMFSCCSYAANRVITRILPGRPDIVSASGAFVIGCLGNLYSRLFRGTAFTSMVTGVLFLVPSGIAQGGGLAQTYKNSADQYSSGFALGLRMISVACGVTIGLFVSQSFVYVFGTRKNAAHFAF